MRVEAGLAGGGKRAGCRLERAAREFEAIFVAELLRPLDRALGGGDAGGILASLGRQSLASAVSGAFGLSQLLLNALRPPSAGADDGEAPGR
jgi:Rod binding domain-containing protein